MPRKAHIDTNEAYHQIVTLEKERNRSNRLYRNCGSYYHRFNENTVYKREKISMPSAELK